MKKFIILIAAALLALMFTVSCNKGNDFVDDVPAMAESNVVDLGLSVCWAGDNLGSAPFDTWSVANLDNQPASYVLGNRYAWAEVKTKNNYTLDNYKWYNSGNQQLTKYCYTSQHGVKDFLYTLEQNDDIAYRSLGGNWRIPTPEEFQELIDECVWEAVVINGVETFKIYNPELPNNILYLPKANYWANEIADTNPRYAYRLQTTDFIGYQAENSYQVNYGYRYLGYYIRPVKAK